MSEQVEQSGRSLILAVEKEIEAASRKSQREVITPEGVGVYLEVAPMTSRLMAFMIDVSLIALFCLTIAIAGWVSLSIAASESSGVFSALFLVAFFVIRTFYFMAFEIAWRGQTPGKRLFSLRVVDAHGGRLTPGALMVRNLTREVELFLPWIAVIVPEQFIPGHAAPVVMFALGWTFILMAMPWLNRDRMRVGDLAASTIVIREPKVHLFEQVTASARGYAPSSRYRFTVEQLDMYGIYEMEVLEDFLRQYPSEAAMRAVAEKIAAKIAWRGEPWVSDVRIFLEEFYDALRARREQQLLFGKRQESKKAGTLGGEEDRA